MSITDELREYAKRLFNTRETVLAIADRIDIAHKHAIGYVDDRDPETMAEHGWVRMPEDADGEYWFCGDKIMLPDGNVVEIIGIGGDWLYYCAESVATTVFGRIRAHDKHHYHEPTVEDMLWELLGKIAPSMEDKEAVPIVKAYAEKLRLADDGEE